MHHNFVGPLLMTTHFFTKIPSKSAGSNLMLKMVLSCLNGYQLNFRAFTCVIFKLNSSELLCCFCSCSLPSQYDFRISISRSWFSVVIFHVVLIPHFLIWCFDLLIAYERAPFANFCSIVSVLVLCVPFNLFFTPTPPLPLSHIFIRSCLSRLGSFAVYNWISTASHWFYP